ncbi:MBL fold metallo-hydrolase [Cohnella massiliensis]|uniref:MBL fold metallo-hydrolase n=1 Tax=Cohnella massiliensis TaxID=1816691 RepID=UPI001FE89AC3|nr:MBL fold metallo-hydrolase [Cohnella massiliensis]
MKRWRRKIQIVCLVILIMMLAGCAAATQNTESHVDSGQVETAVDQQSPTTTNANVNSKNNKAFDSATSVEANNMLADGSKNDMSDTKDKVQPEGDLKVHFIDVGQGASQLLIGPTGKTMLIDAGNNNMEDTVVGYLKNQGISKVDILIGTHPDADHIGGLDAVIDNFDIGKIYMPKVQSNTKTFESVLLSIQKKNLKVTTAKADLTLDWEPGIEVKMIAPVKTYDDDNDMSAVVHLIDGQTSFLFTGDAESKSEHDMITSGADLKSDVLLVGHHGSKSSTSQDFLDKVNPSYAVIQVGKDNSYGHPTAVVLNRLNDKGVKIFRTDEQGNIVFTTNGKAISVVQNPWKYVDSVQVPDEKPVTAMQSDKISGDLQISASIDNESPEQNATVTVTVKVKDSRGSPVKGAKVTLDLHYKSKDTVYEGTTNSDGVSILDFKIGRAAKGFTVDGDITVSYNDKSSSSKVSFTPQ